MEVASGSFLQRNRGTLADYRRRWVDDPLHQWSRQWEYPFAYQQIRAHSGDGIRELRILDAGSGVTFFPSFLASRAGAARIDCCDNDPHLATAFAGLGGEFRERITLDVASLQELPYANQTFDIIYSISVLEHTSEYEQVLAEFDRILRSGGILILTFDISLDGRSDVPPDQAVKLLQRVEDRFEPRCAIAS